jgi:NAD(P)-dependent dehydrogenase (short-subunit alcohol dehydrogenase family)
MGRALVESGCNQLAILDLDKDDSQGAADEMVKWLEGTGGVEPGSLDIRGFACDVSNEESVKKAFNDVKSAFGKVHAVINSAGIVENYPALEYPTERLLKVSEDRQSIAVTQTPLLPGLSLPSLVQLYGINVFGSHFVSREAAKHMIADDIKGSIILVASMSGSIVNVPQPQAPYNASKAAVKHLGACLAVEWAQYGIRVNTLSPGYMLTSLTQQMFDRNLEGKELRSKWENLIPMGKMGTPDDLKGAAVFLASDASRYSTGSDLIVDGGYTAV